MLLTLSNVRHEPRYPSEAPRPDGEAERERRRPRFEPAPSEAAQTEAAAEPEAARSEETDRDRLERYRAELAERYRAELAAARDRCEREAQREIERNRRQLLVDLVALVDDLERAIEAGQADDPVLAGVVLVRDRFLATLERHGVRRIDADGAFDPRRHDAVASVPVAQSNRDGRIVGVHAPGYEVDGEVLRPAAVLVGRYERRDSPHGWH
jgi:molecular chaperone GrpE